MNWRRYGNPYPKARKNPEAAGLIRTARAAKGQSVRVADVIIVGPLMIWAGTEASKAAKTDLGQSAGGALAAMGVGTMAYNAVNWARIKRGEAC